MAGSVFFELLSTSASDIYSNNGGALDYNGYLWSLGGGVNGFGMTRRTRRSSDGGITWEVVSDSSNIGNNGSGQHAAIVYDGYMWVIGGYDTLGQQNNSIRRTTTGVSFSYLTYPNSTNKASGMAACVHNERLYISGGSGPSGTSNGVFSTTDGTTWITHQADGAVGSFSGLSTHVMYSFNGRLWIGGGSLTELWYSDDDGYTWSLYSSGAAPFNDSAQGAVVAYGNVYMMNDITTAVYYSQNGGDFTYVPTSGAGSWLTHDQNGTSQLSLYDGRLYLVGSNGNSGVQYGRTYASIDLPYYNSITRFTSSLLRSPSPAYLRVIDESTIYDVSGGTVTEYDRVWSFTNSRTSATYYYETSASYLEVALEGIYGDTYSVSMSAVF